VYHFLAEGVFAIRLDEDLHRFMVCLMDRYDLYKRRYPAMVALLVSPICLLVNKKLMSRVLPQETLLKASFLL
jgi:hypothetical protein